jgi:magnesium-transporting ATPase (P-type)
VYGKDADGETYTGFQCDRIKTALASKNPRVCDFFKLLSLCHTVRPETVNGVVEYQAESPDEKALTEAAREAGFAFVDTTPEHIVIEAQGKREQYDKLVLLAFNSDRKRMTVVLRAPDGSVVVLCKGADTIMFVSFESSFFVCDR